MGFLYPSFLWGLLAVSIPLAIHFFNFRKTKRVLFTNVSFLKEIETQETSFRRLKHLLILIARMAALACLALAFAQPFWKKTAETTALRGIKSFYLDNSFSMQNEANNKRLIDESTGSLDELLSIYRNLTSLQLITNDFSAEDRQLYTSSGLQDKLTTTPLSPVARSLNDVYKRQKSLLQAVGTSPDNELYWIGDFQKSTTGNLSAIEIDTADRITIIPVQAENPQNIFADSVWLQIPFLRKNQPNRIHVRIRSTGAGIIENLPVRLILNDRQIAASSAEIPARGSVVVGFDFVLAEEGYIRGQISFDDFPVTFDNQFYFVLNASPEVKILQIREGAPTGSNPVNRIYQNDSLFQVKNVSVSNLDVGQISTSDLVILHELLRPSQVLVSAVLDFVQQGGTLLVIPPGQPDISAYQPFLERLRVYGLQAAAGREMIQLEEPDTRIPFFRDVFEASVRSSGMMSMPSASNSWNWSQAGTTLLSLRDGRQFLSQISAGKGKLFLLGASLDPAGSTLAQHALFVPVMYKIAASSVRAEPVFYSFDDPVIELTVPEFRPNTLFKLRRGETELIPLQQLNGNRLVIEIPKGGDLTQGIIDPGYFTLLADDQPVRQMAFNLGKAESELEYYTVDEIRNVFGDKDNITIYDSIAGNDLKAKFEKQTSGGNLWKSFLYAALFFLLAEILLVRFMGGGTKSVS